MSSNADNSALWRGNRTHVRGDHAPPHFHIEAPDFEVLVRISDFAIIVGEARPGQIAEVLRWAEGERPALALRWAELNERG